MFPTTNTRANQRDDGDATRTGQLLELSPLHSRGPGFCASIEDRAHLEGVGGCDTCGIDQPGSHKMADCYSSAVTFR